MKILVTGATGFVGRALCLQFQRDGHRIQALSRSPERAAGSLGPAVQVSALDDLEAQLDGCDAVVNLAGEPIVGRRWTAAQKRRLWDSRVHTTRRLVDAMAKSATPPKTLISASAVGYYGNGGDTELSEDASRGQGMLADLCVAWEEEALRAEEFGCRVVTLRTGIVLGQGGGALESLLPAFRLGLGGRLGKGTQFVPWIHLVDLIRIIATCLENSAIRGPVNAVAPNPVTNWAFSKAIAAALGTRALLPVPRIALRVAMGEASAVLLEGQRARPGVLRTHHFTYSYPTLPLALRDLLQDAKGCRQTRVSEVPQSAYAKARRPTYELTQTTVIDAPIDEISEFFSRAENLGVLTPPNVDFEITSPTPIAMHAGAEITYTIRLGRIPVRWRTQIEVWEKGRRFVDIQLKGPYRCWWHEHSFRADGDRTIMEDRVVYAMPLGILGRLAHRMVVARMLREIFQYRTRAIALRFGVPRNAPGRAQRRLSAVPCGSPSRAA